jgi:uncharacterized caspase-like protein
MIARRLLSVFVAGFALFLTAALALAGDAGKRVALVIGNSDYSAVPRLLNPQNDARDIAATLRRIGFDVTEGANLDFRGMRLAIRDFAEAAQEADVVLVYYAGHGIEIDNTNYLIPVNAELKRDRDVEFEAIRLDAVLNAIEGSDALKIVLVDACRNNPFTVQMTRKGATRSIGRGLARIEPSGVLVGYAAKGGTYALDGEGRNSPYAAALLQHLDEPGLELGKLFRKVRDTVFELTGGQQEPFIYGSLPGRDIFLVEPVAEPEQVAAVASVAPAISSTRIIEDFASASERNSIRAWKDFLTAHEDRTDHRLYALASKRLEGLELDRDIRQGFRFGDIWLTSAVSEDGRTVVLSRENRMLVQEALNMMGYDTGGVDGQFGPKTTRAIAEIRNKTFLATGKAIDANLLRVLPNVHAVRKLQGDLARKYSRDEITPDLEPRLRKALLATLGRELKFGYFQGHLYLAVLSPLTMSAVNALAEKAGGHYVTIQSQQENDFLVSLFSADERFLREDHEGYVSGPNIGLHQPVRNSEPAGGWVWVTGEPLTFRAWSRGNPDNYRNRQHVAQFWRHKRYKGTNTPVKFWDDSTNGYGSSFIIEIE